MPVPISNPNCSAPHSARCWTSSGTSRAFSGTAEAPQAELPAQHRRARPRRTAPHAPAAEPAPAAARRAPRRRTPRAGPPAGGRRRTSGERVCRARPTRSAGTPSCGFKSSRSWRTRPRHPAATASSGRGRGGTRHGGATPAPTHPPSSASAGVSGCSAQRAAAPHRQTPHAGRAAAPSASSVSSPLLTVVLDLVVRLLGDRVGQLLRGEGAGRDGDAGVLGAVVEHRGGDGVGAAEALPPPGVAAVAVGGQRASSRTPRRGR